MLELNALLNLYINCFGFGFFSLWNCKVEHSIFERCFDFAFINVVWKRKAASETSVKTFDSMEFFVFFFFFLFPFATDGQNAIVYRNLDIFFLKGLSGNKYHISASHLQAIFSRSSIAKSSK